jgi:Niemann-Pick C1 protein
MAGMVSIVLALIVSYGFCSMLGIFFGPVHHSLPFLLLGIGVDDMFIIMQNFFNLSPAEKIKPLPEKIGLMMQHAGASITVTSLTDFVAFAIGSATVGYFRWAVSRLNNARTMTL